MDCEVSECAKAIDMVLLIKNIMEMEWDCLIILDACRYDYFRKVYRDSLRGKLERAISPATRTEEWLKYMFRKYYDDIVYISANPMINSKVPVWGFNAQEHFFKIIDVWDYGWDNECGCVPPWEVNEAALNALKEFSGRRFIIHYMQPHAPYMPISYVARDFKITNPFTLVGLGNLIAYHNRDSHVKRRPHDWAFELLFKLTRKLGFIIPREVPRQSLTWKVRKMLNIPPKSPEELFYRKYSTREIQLLYELNLRFVLRHVSEFVRRIFNFNKDLKIVVTADHGELLGERGEIGHCVGWNLPWKYRLKLHEVPWFEVRKPLQVPEKWYGNNSLAEKHAKYFEEYERRARIKKRLKMKVQEIKKILNRKL